MPEMETISWEVLVGNRFTKTLDPAMLSQEGFVKSSSVRRTGDATKSLFLVRYDREYVIMYIARHICRPLSILGKEKVLKLINEAWDYWLDNLAAPYDKALIKK